MNNTTPGGRGAQGRLPVPTPRLNALRACETRIRALQAARSCRAPGGSQQDPFLLQRQVDSALRQVRSCAAEGELRRASPAHLAGMMNSFSKIRDYPVAQGIDAIMACIGQEVGRRASTGGLIHWLPKHQALVTNGLGKAEGPWIKEALAQIARAFLEIRELGPEAGWTPRHLATMANGLAKAEGPWGRSALAHLARALPPARQMTAENGWTTPDLVMMVNGLGKGEGRDVRNALALCAQVVGQRELSVRQGWDARHLAVMANGLIKSPGPELRAALTHMARTVRGRGRLKAEQGWTARNLSMMANGLGKGEGFQIRQALVHLADEVCHPARASEPDWTLPNLVLLMQGLGQTLAGHPVFGRLTSALVHQCGQEPQLLVRLLACLSRFALTRPHLDAAGQLLEALRAQDFRPGSRHDRNDLLWSATVCHFASRQEKPEDPALTASLAQSCQHFSLCPLAERGDGADAGFYGDAWHSRWALDYWQPPSATAGRHRLTAGLRIGWAPSRLQPQVFERLAQALPGHVLEQEVRINDFPVDIMIDWRVCVEVDGPGHFVDVPMAAAGQADRGCMRVRRTKDLFIDHMLHQYGYRVFRLAADQGPAQLDELVCQVRAVVEAPDGERPAPAEDEPQAPGDTDSAACQPRDRALAR